MERVELLDPVAPLRRLERDFLLEQRVRHGHLVLVQKVGQRAVALRAVADDRRRLAVARPVAELLERGVDAVVLRRVDAVHLPVEGREHGSSSGIGKTMRFAMSSWPLLRSTMTHRLSRCFWPAYMTASQIGPSCSSPSPVRHRQSKRGDDAAGDREPLRDAEALAHRTGREVDAGQHRTGMPVEDALVRARVAQDRPVEVAQLGVDRRQRGDRVPLAQDEQVLPAPRRIDDVDVDEAAVVERDERDGGGEGAARVQALVDGVAALLEAQQPNVGVLDRQQLEDAVAQADSRRSAAGGATEVAQRWSSPERRVPSDAVQPAASVLGAGRRPARPLPRARRRGSIRRALRCGRRIAASASIADRASAAPRAARRAARRSRAAIGG